MDYVISLGGSIIVPEKIDTDFLTRFKELLSSETRKGNRFSIITGGGMVCRQYIKAARGIGISERDADIIGVASTKLNAELLRSILGDMAYKEVVADPNKKIDTDKILVGCGFRPGTSSDFDAVRRAITNKVKIVINMSNISSVYDKDPKKFPEAKPIEKISWKGFRKITGDKWVAAMNVPFDPVASKEAETHKLKVIILKGTDLENLKKCLSGGKFVGTVIQ